MGALLDYFTGPKIDSEQQLRDAQAAASKYTPKQNAEARAAGFKDANEMVLFLKARQVGARTKGSASPTNSVDLLAWHPARTIGMASEALRKANNQ